MQGATVMSTLQALLVSSASGGASEMKLSNYRVASLEAIYLIQVRCHCSLWIEGSFNYCYNQWSWSPIIATCISNFTICLYSQNNFILILVYDAQLTKHLHDTSLISRLKWILPEILNCYIGRIHQCTILFASTFLLVLNIRMVSENWLQYRTQPFHSNLPVVWLWGLELFLARGVGRGDALTLSEGTEDIAFRTDERGLGVGRAAGFGFPPPPNAGILVDMTSLTRGGLEACCTDVCMVEDRDNPSVLEDTLSIKRYIKSLSLY